MTAAMIQLTLYPLFMSLFLFKPTQPIYSCSLFAVLSGNIQDDLSSKDVFPANTGHGAKNSFHGSPVLPFDSAHWPAKDSGSGFILLENSKGFLENKDIVAGVIAGGVSGGLIAAALVAILIYKWHKKNDVGYILGQQRGRDEDYHKPKRQEVVV